MTIKYIGKHPQISSINIINHQKTSTTAPRVIIKYQSVSKTISSPQRISCVIFIFKRKLKFTSGIQNVVNLLQYNFSVIRISVIYFMEFPTIPVKVFLLLHFMFTSWALAYPWLPSSYLFCLLMMLTFGIWVVAQPSSHDANQVFLISVMFALLNDCVLIGIYYDQIANNHSSERRFAVAFTFFNLFLKPVTMIFILLGYQEHGGAFDYSRVTQAFGGSSSTAQGEYQDIPEPRPSQPQPTY